MPKFRLTLHARGHTVTIESPVDGINTHQRGLYTLPTFLDKDGKNYMYLSEYFGEHMAGVYEIQKIANEAEMEIIDKSLEN